MKITTVSAKKIQLFDDIYILAVPDEKEFYTFWICHRYMSATLRIFGTLAAKAPDEETLLYLAVEGWNEYREEYLAMLEEEYNADID